MDLLFYGLVRVIIVLAILAPAVFFVTRWYMVCQIREKSIILKKWFPLGANKALYVVAGEGRRYLWASAHGSSTLIDTTTPEPERRGTRVTFFYKPNIPIPRIDIGVGVAESPGDVAASLQILLVLTVLTLAPAILTLLTSFTRTVIVLSLLRNAF